jgi:aminodeoxyfutalosine synthase
MNRLDDLPARPRVSDPALEPIAEKAVAGVPLSAADGLTLYATRDVHGLGRLANHVRERLHGDRTYYNRNRHINYTNVCALSCKFCSFYRKRGEDGAYEMPVEQVIETAAKAADAGATEVHIVGGLHPWLKFDYYLDMLRGIRAARPDLHVKAFTAIEIVHLARIARLDVEGVLTELKNAGLGSLPGGGAEIFDDRVHDAVFKGKVRADRWFDVHRTAHRLGIYTNATMLYGHVETPAERVDHLIKLRELQAESLQNAGCGSQVAGWEEAPSNPQPPTHNPQPANFNCVIPLSFIPEQSELGHLPGPTGLTDLRTLAISRLMLNNIAHIKAFWIMQGIGLSQLSLDWGVDDLDGTVVWYDITKREGQKGTVHQQFHVKDIQRLVREAGRVPVERDTLYHEIERDEKDRPVWRERELVAV